MFVWNDDEIEGNLQKEGKFIKIGLIYVGCLEAREATKEATYCWNFYKLLFETPLLNLKRVLHWVT